MTYEEIIAAKGRSVIFEGIHRTREDMPAAMFPHQVDLTLWALRKGRAAVFADVGLGKSIMQLTWAREVVRESKARGGRARVLIAAPLAVARQTVREGEKWGIPVTYCRGSDESACEIVVTNYDQLDHFDPANFDGFALDESSILKSFTGAMRNQIIDTWGGCHDRGVRYRSAWSATPAPNDFTELGNHSEFLGVKTRTEMLSEFFVHDGGAVQDWRLKGHAVTHFWRWLATWGAVVRSPADLGHDDAAYRLPPKRMHHHVINVDFDPKRGTAPQLGMFALDAGTLHEQRAVRRDTIEERVDLVRRIVEAVDENARADTRVLGQVLSRAPGKISTQPRETGGAQREEAEALRGGSGVSTGHEAEGARLVSGSPRVEEASATSEVRSDPRAIRELDEGAGGRLRDLPLLGSDEAEHVSVRGSLPQDGGGAGAAVLPMQLCDRADAGGSGTSGGRRSLPSILIWCELNAEQDAIAAAFGERCYSIKGADSADLKERRVLSWIDGVRQILISKASITGFGMNFQHCARAIFVGVTHSFEQQYQAERRIWRFGQAREVNIHVISASTERLVLENYRRKEADAARMGAEMAAQVLDAVRAEVCGGSRREWNAYDPREAMQIPTWLGQDGV